MSFENPTSEIYFMNVPFGNDYKNVVSFANKNSQETAFKNLSTKHFSNVNIIRKDTPIRFKGNYGDFEELNYCMYRNPELSNKWWYAFITSISYEAGDVTLINIQTDIWQSYQFDTTYYQSFIDRAHITVAEDNANWYKYTAPEGIGFNATIETDESTFSDVSFKPMLTMDTISDYQITAGSGVQYEYGGEGTGEDMTGIYRFVASSSTELKNQIEHWAYSGSGSADATINHLSDIIGFTYLPKWVTDASEANGNLDFPVSQTAFDKFKANKVCTVTDTVNIAHGALSCGYTPKNKKMYTGLARAFKIWTKNGVSIPLAPELLANQNSLQLKLSMRPLGSTYKVEVVGYKDKTSRYFDLQYNFDVALGINQNVGVARETALQQLYNQGVVLKTNQIATGINTVMNTITGIASAAGSGNLAGGIAQAAQLGVSTGLSIAQQDAANARDDYNLLVAANNAASSITKSIGTNSDRSNMSDDFCRIRLADCSPTLEQCKIMDDFLSAYGYAIQQLDNPTNYMNTRTYWNFIKTKGMNLQIDGPATDESVMRGIFDAGVTIWHGLSAYGNYSNNNH